MFHSKATVMNILSVISHYAFYCLMRAGGALLLSGVLAPAQAQLPTQIGPGQLLSQGAVHYSWGDYDKAARYLYQYVDAAPNHTAARKLLAAGILRTGEGLAQAVDVLTALPEDVWRTDGQYRALLATALLAVGDDIAGLDQLRRLGAEFETPIDTWLTLQRPDKTSTETSTETLAQDRTSADESVTVVDLGPELIKNRIIGVFRLLSQQRYAAAVVAVDELLDDDRRSPLYNHLAGIVHAENNYPELAQGFWQDALRLGKPPLLSTMLGLARLATYYGEQKRAGELLARALLQAPQQIEIILAQAQYWIETGATERAETLLANTWRTAGQRESIVKLIELEIQQGKYTSALTHAEELKAGYPDWSESWLNLGLALLLNGQLGSAWQQFQELTQRQPESAQPWYLMATVSMRAQDYVTALQELEQAISIESDYLPARLVRAEIFLLGQAYERALAEAHAVQNIAGNLGTGFKMEGDIHVAQGNFPAAVDAYAQAYSRSPSMQTALLLNHAQLLAGNHEDAISTLRNWLSIASDASSVRLQLAIQLEQSGQLDDAIQEYKLTLQLEPDNVIVLNNLAWLLRDSAPQQALELAEHALALGTERPEVLDTMGWLLVNSGQQERGLRLLQQAAMLAPHLPLIRYHQALAYEYSQRYEEALEVLAEVQVDELDAELRKQFNQLYERLTARSEG